MDELEDFFTTPRAKDDRALSTEGIEELFDAPRRTTVELDDPETLFNPPAAASAAAALDLLDLEPLPSSTPAPEPVAQTRVLDIAPVADVAAVITACEPPPDFSAYSMNELLEMLALGLRTLAEEVGNVADLPSERQ